MFQLRLGIKKPRSRFLVFTGFFPHRSQTSNRHRLPATTGPLSLSPPLPALSNPVTIYRPPIVGFLSRRPVPSRGAAGLLLQLTAGEKSWRGLECSDTAPRAEEFAVAGLDSAIPTKKLAVFVSGGGSNFRAIHHAVLRGSVDGDVADLAVLVTDKPGCGGAEYARAHDIPVIVSPKSKASTDDASPDDLVTVFNTSYWTTLAYFAFGESRAAAARKGGGGGQKWLRKEKVGLVVVYGQNPSVSSNEGQEARDGAMEKMKKSGHGFSNSS